MSVFFDLKKVVSENVEDKKSFFRDDKTSQCTGDCGICDCFDCICEPFTLTDVKNERQKNPACDCDCHLQGLAQCDCACDDCLSLGDFASTEFVKTSVGACNDCAAPSPCSGPSSSAFSAKNNSNPCELSSFFSKNITEVLQKLNAVLQNNANDKNALLQRAMVLEGLGDFEKAILDYDSLVALETRSTRVFCGRGLLYLKTGAFQKAVDDFTVVLKCDSKHVFALSGRSQAFLYLAQYNDALRDLNVLLTQDSTNTWALSQRSRVFLKLGRQDEALCDVEEWLRLEPTDSRAIDQKQMIVQEIGSAPSSLR